MLCSRIYVRICFVVSVISLVTPELFCSTLLQAKRIASDNEVEYFPAVFVCVYLNILQPSCCTVITRNEPSNLFA